MVTLGQSQGQVVALVPKASAETAASIIVVIRLSENFSLKCNWSTINWFEVIAEPLEINQAKLGYNFSIDIGQTDLKRN